MTIEEMKKRGYITQTTTPEQILDMAKFVTQTAVMQELLKYAEKLRETPETPKEILKEHEEVPETPKEVVENSPETPKEILEEQEEVSETPKEAVEESPETPKEAVEEVPETVPEVIVEGVSEETSENLPKEPLGIISRKASPELMDIAVAQGWCENPDYMTQEEVEKITSINNIDFSSLPSFNEFRFFIGVTKLSSNFTNCNITSIALPKSITYMGKEVFAGCKKLSEIVSLASVAPGVAKSTFTNMGSETDTRIRLLHV